MNDEGKFAETHENPASCRGWTVLNPWFHHGSTGWFLSRLAPLSCSPDGRHGGRHSDAGHHGLRACNPWYQPGIEPKLQIEKQSAAISVGFCWSSWGFLYGENRFLPLPRKWENFAGMRLQELQVPAILRYTWCTLRKTSENYTTWKPQKMGWNMTFQHGHSRGPSFHAKFLEISNYIFKYQLSISSNWNGSTVSNRWSNFSFGPHP